MIVIGGDDNYRDQDEEEQVVISRWARRQVASQFDAEYLDGRKSFIFSWNKAYREIHEEALKHYLDPSKKEQKFQYVPKPKPKPTQDMVWLMFVFHSFEIYCFCQWGIEVIVKYGNKYSELVSGDLAVNVSLLL